MENFELRVRLSVLWLFIIISDLFNVVMSLAEPGILEQLMEGSMALGPEYMFLGAVIALVPLVMAVLSLTLKHSITRWLNIILGILYTVIFLGNFGELAISMPYAHTMLLSIAGIIAPVLIVWYSWKWKT